MENETAQVRILACSFFFFLLLLLPLFVCGNVTKGQFILLHIVAKSPAFPKKKKWTNIRRGEQKILNKCNKFG